MKIEDIPFTTFQSIIDILTTTAHLHPDLPFLRIRRAEGFYEYSYRVVLERTISVGYDLQKKGLAAGERVAVIGRNSPEWIFSYLGILWGGGVVVPLDARATPTEWGHLLRHSECRFLFASSEVNEDLLHMPENIPSLQEIFSFRGEEPSPGPGAEPPPKHVRPTPRTRDDLAVILYTSGTMGLPKGVMLTHGNLLANIEQCSKILDLCERDRFFSVLPLHHSYEATCGFLAPMTGGASVTFARSLKSKELLEDLNDTRPTCFLVVPLLLEKLYQGFLRNLRKAFPLRRGLFCGLKILARVFDPITGRGLSKRLFLSVRKAMGLDQLRYLVSGGAALSPVVAREYEQMGFPVFQGYGLSETSPVLSVNLKGPHRNDSVGLPLPGVEVKIADPDSDGIGEIVVRGPNVMKSYYRNDEATREVLRDGWLHTGDIGKMDPEGCLYVKGRKKSLIVTKAGKNVIPEEIEERLLESPFVKEALVLARIHPRTKTEEIHAIIFPDFEALDEMGLARGGVFDEKDVRRMIEDHIRKVNGVLAEHKRVRHFSIRGEEFPKTTTQKIKRYLFEQGGVEVR